MPKTARYSEKSVYLSYFRLGTLAFGSDVNMRTVVGGSGRMVGWLLLFFHLSVTYLSSPFRKDLVCLSAYAHTAFEHTAHCT